MSYVNYGYDSQRALDSAFKSLSFNNKDTTTTSIPMHTDISGSNNNSNTEPGTITTSTTSNDNNIIPIQQNTFTYLSNNIPYQSSSSASTTNTANTANNNNNNKHDDINSLKLDLQIKETQIQALENEIQVYKKLFNNNNNNTSNNNDPKINSTSTRNNSHNVSLLDDIDENDEDTLNEIMIPENIETILTTLSTNLKTTQDKLRDTENNLESILTAIAINPSNSITKDGRYDIETIAHKMIVRLEILTKENKEMGKMLSFGKSKEINIELNLIKRENIELKEKIQLLESKLNSLSKNK